MEACSACSSPDRSTNENLRNGKNIGVTDADMKELENLCHMLNELDAANLLVEECLSLFTDDLFEVHSQFNPEGCLKYIPNTIDLVFISRLLHCEVDPSLYYQDIDIPEV
ncbi:unnamed protein product [Rotaria socialis]|uniref:Uncharacterized protein n=1 Tax=Rotaria socialis TaxID=392032 RepID=A0A821EU49_9BILA|nr:unnamed protein product [Rotaria socialis]CAF4640961.1 unnamed protein product [Rotaria socialis]